MTVNALNWFEIPTLDIERAARFYSAVLEVPLELQKEDYLPGTQAFFPTEDGVGGALVEANPMQQPGVTGARVYLNARGQIDAMLSRVEAAGGAVTMPKRAIPPFGHIAFILDTEGNEIGLHQPG